MNITESNEVNLSVKSKSGNVYSLERLAKRTKKGEAKAYYYGLSEIEAGDERNFFTYASSLFGDEMCAAKLRMQLNLELQRLADKCKDQNEFLKRIEEQDFSDRRAATGLAAIGQALDAAIKELTKAPTAENMAKVQELQQKMQEAIANKVESASEVEETAE